MNEPIAVVGISAIMPDAPDAATFWDNIRQGRYSISDVPAERWSPDRYYDPDPHAPYKTYSRIGGWVREFPWDPAGWRLPLPPTVATQLDAGQKWAIAAAREALIDAGWPQWHVDPDRVAVIIGNAIGGEKHYWTNLHIEYPEFAETLAAAPAFASLPAQSRREVLAQAREGFFTGFPGVTEDTMPGELANIIAGRVANLFNFRGPNFTTDAACASGLAAASAAVRGLQAHDYDAVLTGGVDRNMGVAAFVKFCKIGALSATGTRPFDAEADGFVMGEGAALFVLKRLSDAERDGDRVYAVLLGLAGSSDGKGKGITAPNPVGQRLAIERAWEDAGVDPVHASYIEAHGTSTRVGDAAELASLTDVFAKAGAPAGSIALGSVKSNIGHLKAAAGAAGLFKLVMSLHEKVLPPSLNFQQPNPNVDWDRIPFKVNSALREWPQPLRGGVRCGGVSAFGFGGTNFHLVLEEHQPGRHRAENVSVSGTTARSMRTHSAQAPDAPALNGQTPGSPNVHGQTPGPVTPSGRAASTATASTATASTATASTATASTATASTATASAAVSGGGRAPGFGTRSAAVFGGRDDAEVAAKLDRVSYAPLPSLEEAAGANVRVAIDYGDAAELAGKAREAAEALRGGKRAVWRMLNAHGVFVGRGAAPKVAFLYTGQGSQYVNMLAGLRERDPLVSRAFAEADRVMTPLLGRPLTSYVYTEASEEADRTLLQTEITQPAVLTADLALTDLLAAYGVRPDMVMGHSLGEYGALVAAGSLSFDAALEAVSARGREMADLQIEDRGEMAAVFGPLEAIEQVVADTEGYVVVANINSTFQAVIGGATDAVRRAVDAVRAAGMHAQPILVSHAFHTSIVAPVSERLCEALRRLDIRPPVLPIVSNVTGRFYPEGADVATILDLLGRQVASPVQFVAGLRTLYDSGARVFVEVGPKKALHGFAHEVLGGAHDDVMTLFTNHPKLGDDVAFNHALCGLYAAGLGLPAAAAEAPRGEEPKIMTDDRYTELGRLFAGVLEQGLRVYQGAPAAPPAVPQSTEPVVITGAALGLPGVERVFDDANVARILQGQQFIDAIPTRFRRAMVDHRITRLVKRSAGDPTFETIDRESDVIKLAGRHAPFDVVAEFGVDAQRDEALDTSTRLAIGAGFDALRDAGIPLVRHYKTTTVGTRLPDRWGLPEAMRDDTGVVFASAFPGYDRFAEDLERYFTDRGRREQLLALEAIRARMRSADAGSDVTAEVDRRIADLRRLLETEPYIFDRRFLFRALAMGHSQFAEIIGARGPNTQVNAACASTTQAICVAEDWIRAGRCRRVIIVSADDATSDNLLPWLGSGFLASGAAATDDVVEEAATPFDRRRHGMIVGMGAAALVVESAGAARERGVQPICEVLAAVTANSAYHGTRLDVEHIGYVMEGLVQQAEARGFSRQTHAGETMFVSHETYTPARGGSAAAEINALRRTFGAGADRVVITNTKGFTGHAMGAGVEDVVAVKALETGIVPPVPNFKEPDPELGELNLSLGGAYPVRYALRLAAGFGSQIAMCLLRWTPVPDGKHRAPQELGYAYRVADASAWQRWLDSAGGRPGARLEVVQHRLRIADELAVGKAVQATPPAFKPQPQQQPQPQLQPQPQPQLQPQPQHQPQPQPQLQPQVVVATPVAAQPVAAGPETDEVSQAVVEIVSGLTGYPPELLDVDLDLEADLGVDTVKQAEVFAAVRERFSVPRDENLRLRDFPTLAHVITWIRSKTVQPEDDDVAPAVVEIVSGLTGYPPELLDVDLDLEADLGVDTVKQAEVFAAVRERFSVPRDENLRLRDFPTLAHVITWIRSKTVQPEDDDVAPAVVEIVSGLTGYPPELLDVDLDLEADLGVDTVKQAEVFAAVRERFSVPRDENLRLRDFPTLTHVIGWIRERRGAAPAEPTRGDDPHPVADAVTRRVPVPALRPPLSRCAATGVTLAEGTRVVLMPDGGGVGEALAARLRKHGVEVVALEPGMRAEAIVERLGGKAFDGVYWLSALDDEGTPGELDPARWHEALRRRVGTLYATMRHLYARQPFLVAATRLGGYHGHDEAGATCPLGGAVTGFAKAYRKECPGSLVKAVDFAPSRKTAALADLLVDETLVDPGCVEVGYSSDGHRWGVALVDKPFTEGAGGGMVLGKQTTFLVTGAAGSIVSAITADLAKACGGGLFHLFDLTPHPDPADLELQSFIRDREAFKLDVAARLRAAGERATPVLIDRELARLERLQAALTAIEAVESAGGKAFYHCVDLTDPNAVEKAVAGVRDTSERVDVLLHAAGVEISHALPDKEPGEFDLVLGVKAGGWGNLMHALGDLPVGVSVAFSSVAGRFGNAGQTDYSAANDLLCKVASNFRRTRPQTRALVLDWTAWAGIGMATRGSIPKVMEAAGVGMLPPEIGIGWVRRELTASGYRGEVVVAGELGLMAAEYHPRGGLAEGVGALTGPFGGGELTASVHNGLALRVELDPKELPFLDHHRIDGIPVLPGVMGMEAFVELASYLVPESRLTTIEDVEFLAPVKFHRDEPRTLTVTALVRPDGADLVADCTLSTHQQLPGSVEPQRKLHFTGAVRFSPAPPEPRTMPVPEQRPGIGPDEVYRLYFHGPAYRVVGQAWREGDGAAARFAEGLPAQAAQPVMAGPRLIELCFQAAGLWEAGSEGRLALPLHVGKVTFHAEPDETPGIVSVVGPRPEGFDATVVDGSGRVLLRVEDYRTVALPDPIAPEILAPIETAMSSSQG